MAIDEYKEALKNGQKAYREAIVKGDSSKIVQLSDNTCTFHHSTSL